MERGINLCEGIEVGNEVVPEDADVLYAYGTSEGSCRLYWLLNEIFASLRIVDCCLCSNFSCACISYLMTVVLY